MNHYLYRHIRPDKQVPFYVGIGTKKYFAPCNEYARAHIITDGQKTY